MPLGITETHPYLHLGEIEKAKKLILGSFPVYEITEPDCEIKQRKREIEGTVQFFYGSCNSRFWGLYRYYVDQEIILPPNPEQLLNSLGNRSIAISDTIISCQRNGISSLDTALIDRTYNRNSIQNLIVNGVYKILCTSKGVLSDLENQIICKRNQSIGEVDLISSENAQNEFIENLNGEINQVTNPILRVFNINNKVVNALAIPSPGSPQRQLKRFGFNGNDWKEYSESYFENAFNWLTD